MMKSLLLKIFILASLLIVALYADAQKPFFQTQKSLVLPLNQNLSTPSDNAMVNEFSKIFSGKKNYSEKEFTVKASQNIKITRAEKEKQIVVSLDFSDIAWNADSVYKTFSVKNELFPSAISCNVFVLNKKSNSSFAVPFSNILIENGKTNAVVKTLNEIIRSDYQVDVKDVKFIFGDERKAAIETRLKLIDDYYKASADLEKIFPSINSISAKDVEHLTAQDKRLSEIEQRVKLTEKKNFGSQLSLTSNDPAKFSEKYEKVKTAIAEKRNAVNAGLNNANHNYYNTAMEHLQGGRLELARKYFNLAVISQDDFSPAVLQLALMDKTSGNLKGAEIKARRIMLEQKPDEATQQSTLELLSFLQQQYLSNANTLLSSGKNILALAEINKAKQFCDDISAMSCKEVNASFEKAYRGSYQEYIAQARSSFGRDDFEKAESTLKNALTLQSANKNFIPDDYEAKYLLKAVHQKAYATNVLNGKYALGQKQFDKAISLFEIAQNMEGDYNIVTAGAPQLKVKAQKAQIFEKVYQAYDAANARRTDDARKLTVDAIKLTNNYSLADDDDVQEKISRLREQVFTKECITTQNRFDDWFVTGKIAQSQKDFLGAHELYERAKSFLYQHEECNLLSSGVEQELIAINPAYLYQLNLYEVMKLDQGQFYSSALNRYGEAGKYFDDNNIDKFGLAHIHLADFAIFKCSDNFMNFLAEYYCEKKELDKSLNIYKALVENKYAMKFMKGGMYKLGVAIAERDRVTPTSFTQNQMADGYTNGNKEMVNFVKGFKKGWNRK